MGHLPIADTIDEVRRHPGVRVVYGHLNNTNPGTGDFEAAADGWTTSL
jgi:hypothetical protein